MSRPKALLLAGVAAVFTVAVASLGTTAAAQTDPAGATRPQAAASWLADQFVDGERLQVTFGTDVFDDPGLTIDAVLALAAAGSAETFAIDATTWLEQAATTDSYVGDGTDESYAGALAKLGLLAQVRGLDPTSWGTGSIDLVARLQSQEQPSGRFTDVSAYGDFSNSIGQSLAMIVLVRQPGEAPSAASIDLLVQSQCPDGGFDLSLEPVACVSGVDTTAYALQALLAADPSGRVDEIDAAIAYLTGLQDFAGGFGTAAGEDPNTNSTGLAVQALRVAGRTAPADGGVDFLAALQQDCGDAAADRGAVAFDATGFDGGTAPRATAQAILGLTGVGYAAISSSGAAAAQPRFDCTIPPTTPTTQPTTAPTLPKVIGAAGPPSQPAKPVVATPSFTG